MKLCKQCNDPLLKGVHTCDKRRVPFTTAVALDARKWVDENHELYYGHTKADLVSAYIAGAKRT